MEATYTKLRTGAWGLRVAGQVREGAVVTAVKRSGERLDLTVGRVVWHGDGVTLCAIGAPQAPQGPRRGDDGGEESEQEFLRDRELQDRERWEQGGF